MYNYDTERMRQVAHEIKELLNANRTPGPNPAVIEQLKKYAAEFKGQGTVASTKTHDLLSYAESFYSVHKYKKHPGGADHYMSRMLGCPSDIIRSSKMYDDNQAKRETADQQ